MRTIWIIPSLLAFTATGCLLDNVGSKKAGATDAPAESASSEGGGGDVSTASLSCPQGVSFKTNADPTLQSRCVTCHATGGSGSSKFPLHKGSQLTDLEMAENYTYVKKYLDESANSPDTMPILLKPLGEQGHAKVLSPDDLDYAGIRTWIVDEYSLSCETTTEEAAE